MSEPVTKAHLLAEIQRLLRELDIEDDGVTMDAEDAEVVAESPVWQEKSNARIWANEQRG